MISAETRAQYRATIGIECHVQLKTKTKLFSAVGNDAREAPPNTLVSHIDFGLPGALPVLNKEAIHLATRAAFALGTEPQHFSKFDRKHYFYPDLPKGYQISQYDEPIIGKGVIAVDVNGKTKQIGITRAHLEEDAGKSTHQAGKDYSLVDLNRAGTPLLEIVSEPDMHTSAEAKAYARELYLRMRYADVSDANLYYGNMRFDVNVSVSKTDELGTRSETKNLNSFRAVEKAVEYEITRQIELLEKGEKIVQETRGWDDAKQKTLSQRTKENADDYRYMPDPDLPPIIIEQLYIDKIKAEMPIMPDDIRKEFLKVSLKATDIETLLESDSATGGKGYISVIRDLLDQPEIARFITSWIINRHLSRIVEELKNTGSAMGPSEGNLPTSRQIKDIYKMKEEGLLNSNNADALLFDLSVGGPYHDHNRDPKWVAQQKGYIQVSDEGEITKIVEQVLSENPKAAEDVKNGEMKAVGFLVGQVMKLSKGKANPQLAQSLIKKHLNL
ncbi:MAG: Asp-tRNA(Asn)/Glu-tRNA(Gln) amidotransferase subunit GatB [Candidatus Saccharimonadales bacterium]